jgi:neutral ceramidase
MAKSMRTQSSRSCRAGFGRRVINPKLGISLAGYFNPRPNTGVLDDLQVKVLLIGCGDATVGLISYDLILIPLLLVSKVRALLKRNGHPFAETIPLCATHTHTGPEVGDVFDTVSRNEAYLDFAAEQTAAAVKEALADLAPAEFAAGSVEDNPFAFNRRYWMKDGKVVTNPGKMNPNVVKPEGPVDRQVGVLEIRRGGKTAGLVVNLSNHTDTTAGEKVSADWPGHMERAIQEHLGSKVPVLTLISPAGNINHVNINDPNQPVYGYAESREIGRGYARIVCGLLGALRPVPCEKPALAVKSVTIGKRTFAAKQLQTARALMQEADGPASGDLTAEDLARGNKTVERFFAQQLLAYVEQMPKAGRRFDCATLKFSDNLAIVFLPGELFAEIGMTIKKASPYPLTFVATLSNGECGYVPLKECFARGGYEVLPVVGGGPPEDTADLLIATAGELLKG